MSSSWERVRRRYRLLEDVLAAVERRGPAALRRFDDAIAAEYAAEGVSGLLRDAERRWQRAFDARLDAVLEDDAADLPRAVPRLWRSLAAEMAPARRLLEAYADDPALLAAQARHRRRVLAATGFDVAAITVPEATRRDEQEETHDREPRDRRDRRNRPAGRRRLRLRPVCARVHRRPVPPAGPAPHVGAGA